MESVDVTPVRRRAEMKAFIDLPWRVYHGNPNWVPPLKSRVARLLDPRRHPFWKFSERELFLARRGLEVVGRIAAIVDGNYNSYNGEKMGIWGFFECVNDAEAAVALFSAAEDWVRSKNMEFLRGPLNPSTNYEVGMLVQGFNLPPALMMSFNPSYYPELVYYCGFRKEKDLLAFHISRDYEPPDWAIPLAERIARKGEITIRHIDPKNFEAEMILLNRVYNDCWANNWGFVPMTDEELRENAKEMIHILDHELAFLLYYREEPVGVFVCVPDINPLLKRFNGKLGITALVKKYLHWSDIIGLRILMFGVKEQYRQMGVPLVAFDHIMRVFSKHEKYQLLEAGWTLEDNDAINRLFVEGGVSPYKRYRIYRKNL
jgi:hypothetical protein